MVHSLVVDLLLMLDDASEPAPLAPADPEAEFREWLDRTKAALRRVAESSAKGGVAALCGKARRIGHDAPASFDLTDGELTHEEIRHHFPDLGPAIQSAAKGDAQAWAKLLDPETAKQQPFLKNFLCETEKQFTR